jgi:beta-glucosidase
VVAAAPAKTPIVAVVLNGRPLTINLVADRVPAILIAWFPGEYGGRAVAEALFGDINPGGKLPVTFPRCAHICLSLCLFRVSYYQCDHLTPPRFLPFFTHTVRRSVGQIEFGFPQKPGSQAGMGTGDDPNGVGYCLVTGALYPFGHGLSYTTFALENPALSTDSLTIGRYTTPPSLTLSMTMAATTLTRGFVFACCAVRWVGGGAGEGVTVTVEVTNTGERAGDEVVQLYLRDMVCTTHTYCTPNTSHFAF